MLILGVVSGAGAYRHGTILMSVLVSPRRFQLVVAQVLASAVAGAVIGLASEAVVLGVALPWLVVIHVAVGVPIGGIALAGAGSLAYCTFSAALGSGLGALSRNQVAAVGAVLIYLVVVDPVLSATVAGYGKFGPAALGIAMSGGVTTGNGPYANLLPALAAGGIYLAATAILVLGGAIATQLWDLA